MLDAWINLVSALCKGNWSFWRAHQRLWWDQSAWKKATSEVNFRISVNTNTCVTPHIPVCLKRFFFQSCRVHEGWSQVHAAEILHWGIWTRITGNCSFWIKGGTLPHLNKNGYITVVSCRHIWQTASSFWQNPENGKYEFRYIFVDIDTYPRRTIVIEDNRSNEF